MSSTAIVTVVKMMETLPEPTQDQVVEHLREYLVMIQDERKWDAQFEQTQAQLAVVARQARQAIREGQAEPLDYSLL